MTHLSALRWGAFVSMVAVTACATSGAQRARTEVSARQEVTPLSVLPRVRASYVAVRYPQPPSERPYVSANGLAPFGYPTRTADRVALLATLHAQQFATLTRWLEEYQQEFERDFRFEESATASIAAFRSADPRLRPLLERWLDATPTSWAPYAARAAHLVAVAEHIQANCRINYVREQEQSEIRALLAAAEDSMRVALTRNSRLLSVSIMRGGAATSLDEISAAEDAYRDAESSCPLCFQAYWTHLVLTNGAEDRAQRAAQLGAASRDVRANPRLAVLQSVPTVGECGALLEAGSHQEAVERCTAALQLGANGSALDLRGRALLALNRDQEALRDHRASLAVRPQVPRVLAYLESTQRALDNSDDGARIVLELLRLSPLGAERIQTHRWWTQRLEFAIRQSSDASVRARLQAHLAALDAPIVDGSAEH